jgi:hypothetical protein
MVAAKLKALASSVGKVMPLLTQISQPTHNKRDRAKITARQPQNLPENFGTLPLERKRNLKRL